MLSTETQLHERIAHLQDEVAYWKSEAIGNAGADEYSRVAAAFGTTPVQSWIIAHLYTLDGKTMALGRMEDDMPHHSDDGDRSNVARVMISRVRKAMGTDAIETVRGTGYRMTEIGIALCDARLKGTPTQ